ncbi:hypothetical protein F5B18DRAFT_669706 [Nemania serpens]|nr:hypothetical protein F5B18DRAFT_669706 [Nemania serpens]
MANPKDPFASFWTYLLDNFDKNRRGQMLDHLHHSVLKELQNPFSVGYTPQYLAYRAIIDAMSLVCNADISVTKHPRVRNDPQPDDQPVNAEGLRYLVESGQTRGELLLDILEGGRASVDRHKLAARLNSLKASLSSGTEAPPKETDMVKSEVMIIPRGPKALRNQNTRELSARAIWKGCDVDEIPIPPVVNIQQHLEPYLAKLQGIWMIWLGLNKERRVLLFRSQEKQSRNETDDMVSDRHRQEFRYIFLSWVQECLDFNQSTDFMEFHCENYRDETESWRKMSEEVVVGLKEQYIDKGVWR